MPVLAKNRRPFHYPVGTKTAAGIIMEKNPSKAIKLAFDNFVAEHGFLPEYDDQLFITVAFTTFDTIAEVSVRPED